MAPVSFANVKKSYGSLEVLHGVSADITDGEFVILVGPSGCGKSTLLRMIAGLESITGGHVKIGNKVVNTLAPKDRDIAMVFQSYALYPHMTVAQNMGFSLKLAGRSKADIDQEVRKAADILALTPLLDRLPKQLSGGQRQRVAMGRAIVRKPQVFLFDEPLSNLDAKLRVQMRTEIKELHQRLKTTTIYVTHDQVEAMTMADRIVIMNGGNVEQLGRPLDLYDRPNNLFVAAFIGSPGMNLLEGVIEQNGNGSAFVGVSGARIRCGSVPASALGRPIVLGCRPEHITAGRPGEGTTPGTVVVVEPTGAETQLALKVGGQDVVALSRERIEARPGDTLDLTFVTDKLHYFDKASGLRIAG